MSAKAKITRTIAGYPVVLVDRVFIADCDQPPDRSDEEFLGYLVSAAGECGLSLRVYKTPGGLRAICVSDFLRPCAPVTLRLLQDFESDWRYNEVVGRTKEFAARLGGKPERMGLKVPEKFNYYALLPKEQREWAANYDAVAINYKACEFLFQTSECDMPPEIANFITLHDERTKCFSDLPMA